nr:asparagine synthetase B [Gemmatimonadota bacterium]NIQ57413.1 asparagine synthetase B [Gemmatimonadota bacterium]NIU77578.1 asparagine synthetase B [Gammaproteobacteria bacterium]NIX46761.1 asparagine synthetase B [Gemmatimonadota bacterium]
MKRTSVLFLALAALACGASGGEAYAQSLLVPMDRDQTNHLKAYGLTFWALEQG